MRKQSRKPAQLLNNRASALDRIPVLGAKVTAPHDSSSGGQRFDHFVQATLVARRLVLVHDTLVDHGVDDRDGSLVGCNCTFLVAFLNGTQDILDMRPQFRAEPHLVKAGFF